MREAAASDTGQIVLATGQTLITGPLTSEWSITDPLTGERSISDHWSIIDQWPNIDQWSNIDFDKLLIPVKHWP